VRERENEPPRSARPALSRWAPLAWYGALAGVVAAPLLRGGYLLLLDFALVRQVDIVWRPSDASPGPVNIAPWQAVLWLLARLGYAAGPLLVFALFLLMGLAAHHAVTRLIAPTHRIAPYFAGTLYAVNPFTYERLVHGQLFLLVAYAMLPLLLVAADGFVKEPRVRTAAILAAWITAVAWTSIHVLAMLPLVLVVLFAFRRDTWRRQVLRWASLVLVAVVLANLWWIVGLIRVRPGELVSARDLGAYATAPRSNAAVGNVAALYGFWRHELRLPKDGVRYWWLLALPVGGLVVSGATVALADRRLRRLGIGLVILIPIAVVLASGTSFSPTRGAFLWLYENVPGFKLFREPQKWVALLPLCYALLAAIGLDRLLKTTDESAPRDRRFLALVGIAALLIPCAYAWTLLWNWERLRPVRFPSDWAVAERTMRDEGGGTVLFLPWHLYMTMSFTRHRVVNPAPSYFTGPVIAGDNVELRGIYTQSQNPVSKAVEQVLFDPTHRSDFQRTLASLCVRWVALANEADVEDYAWLRSTSGLEGVLDGPRITLWRVENAISGGCDRTTPTMSGG
jgi:hypothetical protein